MPSTHEIVAYGVAQEVVDARYLEHRAPTLAPYELSDEDDEVRGVACTYIFGASANEIALADHAGDTVFTGGRSTGRYRDRAGDEYARQPVVHPEPFAPTYLRCLVRDRGSEP